MAARCACSFVTCESSCQVANACGTSCAGSGDLARILMLARQVAASHAQQRLSPAAFEHLPNRTRNSSCRTACLLQEQKLAQKQQVKRQLSHVYAHTLIVVKASTVSQTGTDSKPHTEQRSFFIAFEPICFRHHRGENLRFDLPKQLAQG